MILSNERIGYGNFEDRELRNVVERACILSLHDVIDEKDISFLKMKNKPEVPDLLRRKPTHRWRSNRSRTSSAGISSRR